MLADYSALNSFIKSVMLDRELNINRLEITRSAIKRITEHFSKLGWTIEDVTEPGARYSKHTIQSSRNEITLQMLGGKVYRHPQSTETICRRKHLTKKFLDLNDVPTPKGAEFAFNEKEIAKSYFSMVPKPAVVKPTDSGGSHGVTVGVNDGDEFEDAWQHALAEGRGRSNVLIEQFVKGVELRPYVIGDEVVSIVARVQPFVLGDGISSMETLVARLSASREVNYRAKRLAVLVDWSFVGKQGFNEQSVPDKDRIVFLNPFNYPTIGASIVDVTDLVCNDIKEMAIRAKSAIPYLEIAGIDILAENLDTADGANVVEVNTAAALDMHRYPTHGTPRAIDEDIVRYFQNQL